MSHPICPSCKLLILPGDQCNMVTDPEADEDQRIFTEDQLIVTHETCPERTPDRIPQGSLCESCGEENVFDGVCELCGWKAVDG